MIDIVAPEIQKYLEELHLSTEEQVLLEMEALAEEKSFPIVGRLSGVFLEVMALSINAKRIFEFGSGYGYSAYWFSKAVGPNGKVICSESNQDNSDLAKNYLERAGLWQRVEYNIGWAQDIFKKQKGEFDIIFCDVDKTDYPEVWELSKKKLRKGGLYIADNCLWSGRVAMKKVTDEEEKDATEAIKVHNESIANDKDFRFFINPIRDGLITAYRL